MNFDDGENISLFIRYLFPHLSYLFPLSFPFTFIRFILISEFCFILNLNIYLLGTSSILHYISIADFLQEQKKRFWNTWSRIMKSHFFFIFGDAGRIFVGETFYPSLPLRSRTESR